MSFWGNIAGFLGSLIILAGFARVNVLKRTPDALFNLLNLVGAALLTISLSINYNLPALLLEVAWMGIALYGLYTGLREKR
jgi:hypothetical protein